MSYNGYACLKVRVAHCFNLSVATASARRRMEKFMALGGQTREVELDLGKFLRARAD